MSLELALLRFLKDLDKYERMYKALPKKVLDQRTQILLEDYGKWFREFAEANRIDELRATGLRIKTTMIKEDTVVT